MNLFSLAIPLTAVFSLTNLCGSSFPRLSCFTLNACADRSSLFSGDPGLLLVLFAHHSRFPLAHATSHELWTVGFPNIFPFNKKIQDTHIRE